MPVDVFFISIQATYQSLEIALFKNNIRVASVLSEQARASSSLVPLLAELLAAQGVLLSQCSFIAADAGPGAFTSLRVVIATINGIAFADTIKLVSVSSFDGFVAQIHRPRVLMLLNAYNNDVYFAYAENGVIACSGVAKYASLSTVLASHKTMGSVAVVGNGLVVYPDLLTVVNHIFPITEVVPLRVPSAECIGLSGLAKWQRGETVQKLEPLYLKNLVYQPSKNPAV